MTGISGSIRLTIRRANGQTEEYQTGNAVQAGLASALRSRIISNGTTYDANYVPAQIKVTLSGSGGTATGSSAGSFQSFTGGNETNDYTNSVIYKKNGLTFSAAGGTETVASVELQSSGGTTIASQTSFSAIGGGSWANPGFSPSDKLDVEYTLTFTHTNMGAVDGRNYNDDLEAYRDRIVSNVIYGGTGYDIAITKATIGVDDGTSDIMPAFTLTEDGTSLEVNLVWESVPGAQPDMIKVYTAADVLAGAFSIAGGEYDAAWAAKDNVTAPFAYTVSAS